MDTYTYHYCYTFLKYSILPVVNDLFVGFIVFEKYRQPQFMLFVKNCSYLIFVILQLQMLLYPDHLNINHHIVISSCPVSMARILAKNSGKIFLCYENNNMHSIREKCITLIAGSSILSEGPVVFPDNSGIMMDPVKLPYFMIEAHLINPMKNNINVSLVFRTWMTSKISLLFY